MSKVEYYEAISRIAEEASLCPVLGEFGVYDEQEKDWTLDRRKGERLGVKLEAFILRMYDCCCDLSFKANFPRPTKSYFWKDPNESDFDYVD